MNGFLGQAVVFVFDICKRLTWDYARREAERVPEDVSILFLVWMIAFLCFITILRAATDSVVVIIICFVSVHWIELLNVMTFCWTVLSVSRATCTT